MGRAMTEQVIHGQGGEGEEGGSENCWADASDAQNMSWGDGGKMNLSGTSLERLYRFCPDKYGSIAHVSFSNTYQTNK